MKIKTRSTFQYLLLTVDEESALAKSVLDQLYKLHIQGEFRDILEDIFNNKSKNGYHLFFEQFERLLFWYDQYSIEYPNIDQGDEYLQAPLHLKNKPTTKEWRINWLNDMVRRIWKEVWENHPIREIEAYQFFGGIIDDPQKFIEQQQKVEDAYWKEHSRVMNEHNLTTDQAHSMIGDYMLRGDFGEFGED